MSYEKFTCFVFRWPQDHRDKKVQPCQSTCKLWSPLLHKIGLTFASSLLTK